MRQIDAIIDLIKTVYPNDEDASQVSFNLSFENGMWHAKVSVTVKDRVTISTAKNKATAEEALDCVYQDLVSFNRSVMERIKAKLAKWVGLKPTLCAVPSDTSKKNQNQA